MKTFILFLFFVITIVPSVNSQNLSPDSRTAINTISTLLPRLFVKSQYTQPIGIEEFAKVRQEWEAYLVDYNAAVGAWNKIPTAEQKHPDVLPVRKQLAERITFFQQWTAQVKATQKMIADDPSIVSNTANAVISETGKQKMAEALLLINGVEVKNEFSGVLVPNQYVAAAEYYLKTRIDFRKAAGLLNSLSKLERQHPSALAVEEKVLTAQPVILNLEKQLKAVGSSQLKKVYKSYGEKVLLKGFDYTFKKGERIGIVGKNGAGKSTFINILQGLDKPDNGKINIGDTVIFGNYSQTGLEVKTDMRVIEFVKNIAEHFPLASGGTLSAAQFLQLFLFDPDKQYTYISKLSGGEKRRLHLLSILFRNPNFLILDEPTNDLDLPTLGVLENFLSEFPGCLLIVSHDRYFMDRLVDHLFVFEGDGMIKDFPGNYSLYRESIVNGILPPESKGSIVSGKTEKKEIPIESEPKKKEEKKQFSFKEKREFELLEKEIEDLTKEKKLVTEKLNNGDTPFEELQKLSVRIGEITQHLDEKEFRWLELSEMKI